jgi:transposase
LLDQVIVVDKRYSITEACTVVGVSDSAMCKWVRQLREEGGDTTPIGSRAITPEQQRIQELEARIRRIEREKDILKKATALLMSDPMRNG